MDWLRCQNLLLYSLKFYFRIWLLARSPLSPKKALFFNDMLQPNYFSLPKIMRFTKRSSPFISFMKLFIASLYFIMLIYIFVWKYMFGNELMNQSLSYTWRDGGENGWFFLGVWYFCVFFLSSYIHIFNFYIYLYTHLYFICRAFSTWVIRLGGLGNDPLRYRHKINCIVLAHMVFTENRGGIDRQLTANEEGGSHGFHGEQRGYWLPINCKWGGGITWFSGGTEGVLTAN